MVSGPTSRAVGRSKNKKNKKMTKSHFTVFPISLADSDGLL